MFKINIVGPAHPFRGGLGAIMQSMAREFISRDSEVKINTFTTQYPAFLFPGESQTVDTPPPADLDISRTLSTINPLSWLRLGLRLRRERPDFILMKYWTPFMAPSFGAVARLARGNGHTKVICQIDNVEPHEHHIIDRPFNRFFLRSVDGFIYMSEQVHSELMVYTSVPQLFSPHPMFENFGERLARAEAAAALGVAANVRYALFFGLIRDYKGLDILLEALSIMRDRGTLEGRKLIVAGEFYTPKQPYLDKIEASGLAPYIVMHDRFIPDEYVSAYFSLADFLVLPYHSASQSGVTQIAYNFSLPMVVTNVGGLPEIVPDGRVGLVCEPTGDGVAEAMTKIWEDQLIATFTENFIVERRRFSWAAMCDKIEELYALIAPR
ncbi:MAG: glycosyltransferase family 4 protein [Rikenellaceae bacterium]